LSVVFDGITSPEVLEAWACSEALSLAEDLHARKLKVASDCLNVVKEIQAESAKEQHWMIITRSSRGRSPFLKWIVSMNDTRRMKRLTGLRELLPH
jgi:ABC-type phosphate transport system ATPase subunit